MTQVLPVRLGLDRLSWNRMFVHERLCPSASLTHIICQSSQRRTLSATAFAKLSTMPDHAPSPLTLSRPSSSSSSAYSEGTVWAVSRRPRGADGKPTAAAAAEESWDLPPPKRGLLLLPLPRIPPPSRLLSSFRPEGLLSAPKKRPSDSERDHPLRCCEWGPLVSL